MTTVLGPVPVGSDFYANRTFEADTMRFVMNREWVLILGPRQHGKTSALIRIREALISTGFRCALVDLQRLPPIEAFPELLSWFAREVATSLEAPNPTPPDGREDEIEAWLGQAIPKGGPPTIILIDEVSAVRHEDLRNSFFGQIRALKTASAAGAGVGNIGPVQFVFAGTFRQETMVAPQNSPFNVSRRVETEDLTQEQIAALCALVTGDDGKAAAQIVYEAVGGQPHLVQHMISAIEDNRTEAVDVTIDAEFTRLLHEGSDHLDGLFRLVFDDPPLTELARAAASGGEVANDAANNDSKYMIAVGLMKRDGGRLVFRNRLYEEAAKASAQLRPEQAADAPPQQHLVALSEDAFLFITDAELREIAFAAHNGGVASYNQGAYRMALVGFGVCVEAMLIAWLSQRPPVDLAAGVAAARALPQGERANFNQHEDILSASTWRLVNLMKVARQMNGVRGPIGLPDSIRDMRNFVHPKLMKENYLAESALQPEAMAAGAFTMAIKRDLS